MGSYVSRGERFFFNPCKSLTWFIQNCLLAECQNGRKICDQLTRNGSRGEVRWDFNFITFSIFQLPLFKRFMNTLTFAYYYLAQRHTYFGLNSMKSWSIVFVRQMFGISQYMFIHNYSKLSHCSLNCSWFEMGKYLYKSRRLVGA